MMQADSVDTVGKVLKENRCKLELQCKISQKNRNLQIIISDKGVIYW